MHPITPFKPLLALLLAFIIGIIPARATFVGDRSDFRDESVYFVMTTRFYDGDPSNNVQCWDGASANSGDPCWRGDFKGLIEKLDYIKALGFTAIWITPVVENASGLDYHGYHARNFSKVDHRYESEDVDFQDLIDAAHAKGIKIMLDIVLNHTGNFGEENLCKLFTRDWSANQFDINACMKPYTTDSVGGVLPTNYSSLASGTQYDTRLKMMKNTDGQNHDSHNYWHHFGQFNWDDNTRWWAQIAGDCVDLNTENPAVYNYLIDCYGTFIKMGVDGFRIDTGGHIARLTFNKAFIPAFESLAEQYKSKRLNSGEFYMCTEVCARFQGSVTYRGLPALSPYFYTWAETNSYSWNSNASYWDNQTIYESTDLSSLDNISSCQQQYSDNQSESSQPTSSNATLNGNTYHTPDVSKASGLHVIDFPVHYSFNSISSVWDLAINGDKYYNDATYNLVYVDSHDYCPGPNDNTRFNGGTSQWAENMCLMFTFRGIPCLYYGSEIEFKAGQTIDPGGNGSLINSGRAYYGGYIKGDVTTTDFGQYSSASGNMAATLSKPLVKHLQRLNRIRQAVPALRKGQYSTSGCSASGGYAFKRRYTDSNTDSYVLVSINSGATFTNVLNGTYTDCITGDVKTVTNNTLTTTSCSGQGNMRVYVLSTSLTPAPGKIGEDGPYLYTSSSNSGTTLSYDGTQEELSSNNGEGDGQSSSTDDLEEYTPSLDSSDELSVFLETDATNVTIWVWDSSNNYTGGSWPGQSMTLMGKTSTGRRIYKWTYSGSLTTTPSNVIFVMNGTQTSDLTYVNHGYYIDGTYNYTVTNVGGDEDEQAPTLTIDKASGTYNDNVTVNITASESDATIVYTTDGTTPTASSTQATGSVSLTFGSTTTLKVGILYNGSVKNVLTRTYTITSTAVYTPSVTSSEVSVFLETDGSTITTWVWDSSNNYTGGTWPGQSMTYMGLTSTGRKIYKWTYNGSLTTMPSNIIFVVDGTQTSDLTFTNHGYYIDGTYKYTVEAESGDDEKVAPTLTIDKATGTYTDKVTVTITASESDATIVYTTDGTTPTANSTQAIGSTTLTFEKTTTLKVGVLYNGSVTNVVTRTYTINSTGVYTPTVTSDEVSVFLETDGSTITTWVWDSSNNYTGGTWPGQSMTYMGLTSTGRKIYKWTYSGSLTSMPSNIIFVVDGTQTSDLTFTNHGYYIDGTYSYTVKAEGESDDEDAYTPTVTSDEVSVFLETDGSTITTWVWDSSNNYTGGTWPGQSMTYMGLTSTGRKIYKWTYSGSLTTMPSNIIFVVDGTQTSDLTFINHGYYIDGTYKYTVEAESGDDDTYPKTATVYLKDPTASPNNWSSVYYYAWDSSSDLAGSWPGTKVTTTTTVNGDTFYCMTFSIPNSNYSFNMVFSQGDSDHQTVDVTGIKDDIYLEITSTTNKYTVNDITEDYASTTEHEYKLGDVNHDGEVDVNDVTALIATILGNGDGCKTCGEVNGDGEVDVNDVTALIALILGN